MPHERVLGSRARGAAPLYQLLDMRSYLGAFDQRSVVGLISHFLSRSCDARNGTFCWIPVPRQKGIVPRPTPSPGMYRYENTLLQTDRIDLLQNVLDLLHQVRQMHRESSRTRF